MKLLPVSAVAALLSNLPLASGRGAHYHDHHDHHHHHDLHHDNDDDLLPKVNERHLEESPKDWCAAPVTSAEEKQKHDKVIAPFLARNAGRISPSQETPYMVSTHWHEIRPARDSPPPYEAQDSIDALNVAFAEHGFQFFLETNEIVVNPNWYYNVLVTNAEQEMKSALRVGGPADLNVYMVDLTNSGGVLGFATFPYSYPSAPELDGVVCQFDTVPGGPSFGYNQGDVLVHEVGHWLGLYHTFDGGCNLATGGDLVDDTPAVADSNFGCPTGIDSCPNAPGLDQVENYMDYTYDYCKDTFTPGQAFRMEANWCSFRSDECEDGAPQITAAPTPENCEDCPEGWYDSDGPSFDCVFYSYDSNCARYGDDYENFGATANEACCVCGGGCLTTSAPSPGATSSAPTMAPVPIQIQNNNFERDNNRWKVISGDPVRECGTGVQYNGNCAYAFYGSSSGPSRIKNRVAAVDGGSVGDVFTLSFKAEGVDLPSKNSFKALVKIKGSEPTKTFGCKSSESGSFEYTMMECTFTIDRDFDTMLLLFQYSGSTGAVYLDHLLMEVSYAS